MDALLGRHKKSSRLIALAKLAISRIAVLKNQRRVRSSLARSDVIQLLHLGEQDRALLRTELVIKEQSMFDALSMIEGYCNILAEGISLLEKNNMEISDHLKEAIASLMFAAPRCGEFPELREICRIIWKEFTASAVQIHDKYSSGVNSKIVSKLTLARQPSLDSRWMALKEIATENGIQLLPLGDDSYEIPSQDTVVEAAPVDPEMIDESPREANEDEKEAVEESCTDAAAFIPDLENPDHDNGVQNVGTTVHSELPSQNDSLGRHLTRQNCRVLERKHRNNNTRI